jgi:lysophospholipase L1-like esterase
MTSSTNSGRTLAVLVLILATASAVAQTGEAPVIVVLGSSTATGASSPAASWAELLLAYVQDRAPAAQVITTHNVTMALACEPDAIIVNLPSHGVDSGSTTAEVMANYQAIATTATAHGVPVWVTTTQPRNFSSSSQRDQQREIADLTRAAYGTFALDVWNGFAASDATLLPQYDSGDGVHLNDAGHALFFARLADAGIWERLHMVGLSDPSLESAAPRFTQLLQNAPNPFNPTTAIRFDLSRPSAVSLVVHDLHGRPLRKLVQGILPAQEHTVSWDGRDDAGQRVPSGTYLIRLQADGSTLVGRMLLLK